MDPAQDPNHELDLQPQDLEGVDPDIPLARVVSLLRVLGGSNGHAEVKWFRGGHWHMLSTTRGGDVRIGGLDEPRFPGLGDDGVPLGE